ncbi:MAG: polyphosphate kinase 1 [Acidobacteriota bacterium]
MPREAAQTRGGGRAPAASKAKAGPETRDLNDPQLYINRELSLLAFQRRVLEEAEDRTNPLLERAKFLSILGSNLDEFFMVRVAGLAAQVDAGSVDAGPDGLSPRAQLAAIRREVKKLFKEAHQCLDKLLPLLEEQGIRVHGYSGLSAAQAAIAREYFFRTVFPVLTPLAFDPGRPFPHISNLSLNLAVLIRDRLGQEHFARVKVPESLPPLVPISGSADSKPKRRPKRIELVWLEEIIAANLDSLFPGMEVLESYPFHVTRDAEMAIKELEAEDLLETIEEGVRQRRFGTVIRLMVTKSMPARVLSILMTNLEVEAREVYRVAGPLSLKRLMSLHALDRPELKEPPFVPALLQDIVPDSEEDDLYALIRSQNILLHHPFDSFQPVIEFLKRSARDPDVVAIKICLYRVGRNSPIVESLLEAAQEDKQVAALVELKARFDEESNIEWARALEREGVHVVYGLVGLKIHCKVALVVRREGDRMMRYVHLSTGNYNAVTAHLYTDIGMLTADEQIADDAADLFNYLTGYSAKSDYRKLLVAPVNLRSRLETLIAREIEHARKGRGAHLIFKMNSLVDCRFIQLLYRASNAGVKIDLLVRGICCLRPGIPGVSENIRVLSIVGRFLEHSRAFYFRNDGKEQLYLGSADLMPRNIDHRVEVLFPVEDPKMLRRIRDNILEIYLHDTVKARRMQPDGSYVRVKPGGAHKRLDSQAWLLSSRRQSAKTKRAQLRPR